MDNISEKQYENLRKNFYKVIKEVLGEEYYNMGADVYSTDTIACEDIIHEYKQMKKERDHYRWMASGLSMTFVLGIVLIHLFIL